MSPLITGGRSRHAAGSSPLTSTLTGLEGILDSVEANIFVADPDFVLVHRFHKDPAAIEGILRNPRNFPYRFGNVVLDGRINAVTDDAGAMPGYCIAWEDVTQQEAIEETARQVAAQPAAASTELTVTAPPWTSTPRRPPPGPAPRPPSR